MFTECSSLPQISAILTVNSGLAHEAPYFGKRVHALAPSPLRPAWRGAAPDTASHASLNDVVLTPDSGASSWRLLPRLRRRMGCGCRRSRTALRIALDSFWNYQDIDTDPIPAGRSVKERRP